MAVVEGPRVDRTKSNNLEDILVLSVLAVLFGAEGWEEMVCVAKEIHQAQGWCSITLYHQPSLSHD
jgi:hypothetical protein